jgi:class 3 adenylate cyclase/predicted ATPase
MLRCPACDTEHDARMRFCGECGAALPARCARCAFENPPGFKFCGACGNPLDPTGTASSVPIAATAPLEPSRPPEVEGPDGERRQLTVMFCDLVGSTALSEHLDPEELREVLVAYQEACGVVIGRFGGSIARYLGDGLLVYFGFPLAHEDDAHRAVRAGLAIVEELHRLDARFYREKGIHLAARLAVHTGRVVVGEIGAADRREAMAIVGDTPNIAARLQDLAAPNTVVISAATYRLIEGYFVCDELGARPLKGISQPVGVYQVVGEAGERGRLDVASVLGLSPLVGRSREVDLLLECWERARSGEGQVALLGGEPGIGKSRLVQVLTERVVAEPHLLLGCRCSPYQQNSAFHPVIRAFEHALGFGRDTPASERHTRLDELLTRYDQVSSESRWLLSSLLSLTGAESSAPPDMTPDQQRHRLLNSLLHLLSAMASEHPLLVVVEDLQWADASTLELLELVIAQAPTAGMLAVLTFRPEFTPPWPHRAHLAHLTLGRLPRNEVLAIVKRVARGKALPDVVLQQILARTDGIPLFVEELTKTVLESGVLEERDDHYELPGPLLPLAIPTTLQDSLLARLDRLGEAKEVAQWGATLGREFTYDLLRSVTPQSEEILQRELARLVSAELLYQRGVPPRATYSFKHALIQATAYESLLKSRRQQYHRRIATTLVERFPEIGEADPATLARHYAEAGLTAEAVACWQRAGQRAIERSANSEAIGHLTQALDALRSLPGDPVHLRQELTLLTALGPALMPTSGYGSPEVGRVYGRALAICREIGESTLMFPVVRGLWEFSEVSGDLRTARETAEELLRLASEADDSGRLVIALNALGETLSYLGEFPLAREHLERGIALYDPERHRGLADLHGGYDPGVMCRVWSAFALWHLGYPDRALARCGEALDLAHALAHPNTLPFALSIAAIIHHVRRDAPATREAADAVIALATEKGFTFWVAFATMLRGWAISVGGQVRAGLSQVREGLATWEATGARVERPLWLALLAEVCASAEQVEEGLAALDEGHAVADAHGLHFHDAEILRLRGELLLSRGEPNERQAEDAFRQAMRVAREQRTLSLELRSATSLGHLWKAQGRPSDAHSVVTEVYSRFSEGHDSPDLRAAQALLDSVNSDNEVAG